MPFAADDRGRALLVALARTARRPRSRCGRSCRRRSPRARGSAYSRRCCGIATRPCLSGVISTAPAKNARAAWRSSRPALARFRGGWPRPVRTRRRGRRRGSRRAPSPSPHPPSSWSRKRAGRMTRPFASRECWCSPRNMPRTPRVAAVRPSPCEDRQRSPSLHQRATLSHLHPPVNPLRSTSHPIAPLAPRIGAALASVRGVRSSGDAARPTRTSARPCASANEARRAVAGDATAHHRGSAARGQRRAVSPARRGWRQRSERRRERTARARDSSNQRAERRGATESEAVLRGLAPGRRPAAEDALTVPRRAGQVGLPGRVDGAGGGDERLVAWGRPARAAAPCRTRRAAGRPCGRCRPARRDDVVPGVRAAPRAGHDVVEVLGGRPQYWQRWPSRANTARRDSGALARNGTRTKCTRRMTVGTGTPRRSERNSAPLRCTISAFSFSTSTTARRDDTTHSGSKLALSKSARATRYPPPGPYSLPAPSDAGFRRVARTTRDTRRGRPAGARRPRRTRSRAEAEVVGVGDRQERRAPPPRGSSRRMYARSGRHERRIAPPAVGRRAQTGDAVHQQVRTRTHGTFGRPHRGIRRVTRSGVAGRGRTAAR